MGGDILRRFKVIFDYSRQQMILERNGDFEDPFEYDMSGLFLTAEGQDYRSFSIGRAFENTPAAEAGLRENDEIVTLNGRPSASFTLDQLQQMFRQDGREYQLTVKRAQEMLLIKIKLRRMV